MKSKSTKANLPNFPYVYNVLIGGCSIGLTYVEKEAQHWLAASSYPGKKEIRRIINTVDRRQYYAEV